MEEQLNLIPVFDATVVITTRDRHEDVRRALLSCVSQIGVRLEILVYDDASSDGTDRMIDCEFPDVRVIRSVDRLGYIVLRNRGFRDALSPIVLSLDDDALFTSPETVAQVVRAFRMAPNVAAFALKYRETQFQNTLTLMPEMPSGSELRSYIGCAHAVRKDIALNLGGYREFFVHQGEEKDLCIRMRNQGYSIQFLNCPAIIHNPSPKRDQRRWHYFGIRNTFLFTLLNVPTGYAVLRFAKDMLLLLRHSMRTCGLKGWWWVIKGLLSSLRYLPNREPVLTDTYRRYQSLNSAGPSGIAIQSECYTPAGAANRL